MGSSSEDETMDHVAEDSGNEGAIDDEGLTFLKHIIRLTSQETAAGLKVTDQTKKDAEELLVKVRGVVDDARKKVREYYDNLQAAYNESYRRRAKARVEGLRLASEVLEEAGVLQRQVEAVMTGLKTNARAVGDVKMTE